MKNTRRPAGATLPAGAMRPAGVALLAGAMLLAAPEPLDGQRVPDGQRAYGVRGGVTFADAHFYDAFTSRAERRAAAGGFAIFPVSPRVDVQLEVLYLERGFSTSGEYEEGSVTRISYLDFPILMRYRLTPEAGIVRPMIFGGGYWGRELRCRTGGGVAQVEQSDSCDGRFKRRGLSDVGLIVGASLEATVRGPWFILADARYHYGVRNLYWDPASDGVKSRNLSLTFGVGMRLAGGAGGAG